MQVLRFLWVHDRPCGRPRTDRGNRTNRGHDAGGTKCAFMEDESCNQGGRRKRWSSYESGF